MGLRLVYFMQDILRESKKGKKQQKLGFQYRPKFKWMIFIPKHITIYLDPGLRFFFYFAV